MGKYRDYLELFEDVLEIVGMEKKTYYTRKEVAKLLGISVRKLDDMRVKCLGPRYAKRPDCKKILYPIHEIAKFYIKNVIAIGDENDGV